MIYSFVAQQENIQREQDRSSNQNTAMIEMKVKSFMDNLRLLKKLHTEGKMNQEKAELYLEIQKSSLRNSLTELQVSLHEIERLIHDVIQAIHGKI